MPISIVAPQACLLPGKLQGGLIKVWGAPLAFSKGRTRADFRLLPRIPGVVLGHLLPASHTNYQGGARGEQTEAPGG